MLVFAAKFVHYGNNERAADMAAGSGYQASPDDTTSMGVGRAPSLKGCPQLKLKA